MPVIYFRNRSIECAPGENLRKVLIRHKVSPYNGAARLINCHGLGSCGTCAVRIRGVVPEKSWMERWRLRFPPHREETGLRLACQVRVWADLVVEKGEGFWGQHVGTGEKKSKNKERQRNK